LSSAGLIWAEPTRPIKNKNKIKVDFNIIFILNSANRLAEDRFLKVGKSYYARKIGIFRYHPLKDGKEI
jgi:hypothetical protein